MDFQHIKRLAAVVLNFDLFN